MMNPETTTRSALARLIDHSVLNPEATEEDVVRGATIVRERAIAFYCVQPCRVALAADALGDTSAHVVSVIGFPHGADRSVAKARAAELAVQDGAAELAVVLNVGLLRSGALFGVRDDVATVVRTVPGVPVKVILETCLLTDELKRTACRLVEEAGAAFVQTSTGFHPLGGATAADVRLLRSAVGPRLGVAAAGGIRTLGDALAMLEAGASRLGLSSSAAILEALPA